MFKLIRKVSTMDEFYNSERFSKVEEINKILEEGWDVKHIESFVVQDKILLTQLLLYKKDDNELTNSKDNSKEYNGPKPITDYPTYGQIYGEQNK